MHRFAIDIDPVAYIRNMMDGKNPDPVQSIVLSELGGAESIVCYLRDDEKTVKERDVTIFRNVVQSYLNVRTNLTEENIRKLIRLKPDMITFVAPGDAASVAPCALDLDMYTAQLQDYIAELRSNDILSSVMISPDINQVKSAGKIGFDYIEIDLSTMEDIPDLDTEMEFLESLSGLTLAASKIGMGTNISGPIGFDNIRDITAIDHLEDIIVGRRLLAKALAIGIEQAVRDMRALF